MNGGVIRPQPGPQEAFLAADADIVVYGGAAGGGKSYGLMMEPLYDISKPGFNAVYFRRTMPQIKNPGGLWDESYGMYPQLGAKDNKSEYTWTWGGRGGAYIKFDSLQYESTLADFQGAQIPLILFDELTHFTERQFFYMLSRNRLGQCSGVRPRLRATTNPDGASWVKRFLAPWLDKKHSNPARPGECRYFVRHGDTIKWVDKSYRGRLPGDLPKSVTFIPASVYDNKILLERDPGYLANLHALPLVDRQRLLFGDWDVMPEAGKVFNRYKFRQCMYPHAMGPDIVRFWDFAATEKTLNKNEPDYTVGVKMMRSGESFFVLDVIAEQVSPADVDALVIDTALRDGRSIPIRWELEGGASGKLVAHYLAGRLQGYDARGVRPYGDKIMRSRAFASQVHAGNIWLVENLEWNEPYLQELHHFPNWNHDDRVDASSGAYNYLITEAGQWDAAAFGTLAQGA